MLLILTMLAALIMGMALPTVVSYMVLAVLVAPTLIDMGVLPIAAHMFVIFFGVISYVTPPIAFAAYAGAALAGANPMKTAVEASKLAICSFILPFMFVYNSELLLQDANISVVFAILSAIIGIVAISMAVQGYIFRNLNFWQRLLIFVSGLILVDSNIFTDIIGYLLFGGIILYEYVAQKNKVEMNI